MRKIIFLTIFVCLLAISAFAQDKTPTDFSGDWTLDVSKSRLDERMRVESITMNVKQTDKELTIEIVTKRVERPEGAMPNGGMRRGSGGGMSGGMGGDGTTIYNLDGKETTAPVSGGAIGGVSTMKAEVESSKLKLTNSRKISSQMGDFTFVTKETWELTDSGKTLKVVRETETRRGNISSEMIFTKK